MSIAEKFVSMEYGPAPEDAKEAQAWLERHGHRFGNFINNQWQAPAAGAYFDTIDPSNGEKLAAVAQSSAADLSVCSRSLLVQDRCEFGRGTAVRRNSTGQAARDRAAA